MKIMLTSVIILFLAFVLLQTRQMRTGNEKIETLLIKVKLYSQ